MMSRYVGAFDFRRDLVLPNFGHNDEMTAIATILSPFGFVIGADGLRKDTLDNSTVTETAQKIFVFETEQTRLVFAWTGSTTLIFPGGKEFDLIQLSKQFCGAIEMTAVSSFADLVTQFRDVLLIAFRYFADSLPKAFFNREMARVIVLSYFHGQPCQAEIAVECGNAGLLQPNIVQLNCPAPAQFIIFSGSEAMYKQFVASREIGNPETREKAIELVRDYIRLCVDNRNTDPESFNIGGHIHVGVLTPHKFEWIEPPRERN